MKPEHDPNEVSWISRLKQWFAGRKELRYAGLVTLATVSAQVMLLLTAPLLARIYTPADFGHLTLLLTSSTIGGSVASFCYHFVILLPRSNRVAAAAYRLSMYASLIGSALATGIYWLIVPVESRAFGSMPIWVDLALIYAGILSTSVFNILGTVHSRASQYKSVAVSKFSVSFFPTITQITFGFLPIKSVGLQLGRLLGVIMTCIAMSVNLPKNFTICSLLHFRLAEIRLVAWRYRDSILHVPRELLMRAGTGLPPALLLAYYDAAAAGYYFFAERLVERPGLLLSDALTRIPMKIFAENLQKKKPVVKLALIYTVLCTVIVTSCISIIVFGGKWLFGLLFGSAWVDAADYATALAIGAGVRISILPVAALVPVFRIQRYVVVLDAIFFARVLVIPAAASLGYSAVVAVGVFAAVTVVYNVATFAIAIAAGIKYERGIKAKTGE
ncbi:MAG: oligosaccharide flippase family protein [Pseudoruegeria sp.]